MTELALTSSWLLRGVRGSRRVSRELWARYLQDRAGVAAETAREAARLGAQARAAVSAGWRPAASKNESRGKGGGKGKPCMPAVAEVVLGARRSDPKGLAQRWRKRLHPEQKTALAAGTNGGGYSTRFGRYCRALTEHVAASPGTTLGDAERAVDHPFSSRRSFMSLMPGKLAVGRHREPRLAGVRLDGKGVRGRLWPTEGEF